MLRAEADERVTLAQTRPSPDPVFAPSDDASPAPVNAVAALGPSFDRAAELRPTGDAGQSKLWFHDGRWWGLLLADDEFRIHAFHPAEGWVDTGTVVDTRPTSHADVLTEGAAIVVAGAGRSASAANALEIRRFAYDPGTRTYRADRQFPIRVTSTGARSVTLARTGDGTLWAAFVIDQRLEVAHSVGDDRNWTEPETLPLPDAAEPVDAAAIAASGTDVAVLAATTAGTTFAATTTDAGATWAAESLLPTSHPGEARTVALRAGLAEGPRFVGVTEIAPAPDGEGNALAAHVVVIAGDAGGWSTHAVSRVEDRLADPTLLVDEGSRSVVVLTASDGTVRSKRAPLDRLVFPSGRGVPVLPADVGARFQEPTTARFAPAGAGLLVVAADGGIGRYGHVAVDVPDVAGRAGKVNDGTLLVEGFEGRPVSSGPPPGWQLASDAGTGELALGPGLDGLGLRLTPAQEAGSARACRRFVPGRAAGLEVSLAVRYAGEGAGDLVIASLRGKGEAASVRIDDRGRLAWFAGDEKQVSARTLAPATWYRVEVAIDPTARTYGLTVREAGGEVIEQRSGVGWRVVDASAPDQLCVSTREGVGAEITIDDVRVQRR